MATIKDTVKDRYAEAARSESCCSASASSTPLGCGKPLEFLGLKSGETVLDLGSGPGIEVMSAADMVGDNGKVIGVDMTREMIDVATGAAKDRGYENVEFRVGDIEELPLEDGIVDAATSNCVINLAPDKGKVFAELYRVLKAGGRFCVSDVVSVGRVPDQIRNDPKLWSSCIAGAMDRDDYLDLVRSTGFENVKVLREFSFGCEATDVYALLSITVKAEKPSLRTG